MAGTRHGYGVARSLLIALAVLLVAGAAGSLFMGSRERNDARNAIAEQAATITDSSLTLVFRPEDTMAEASEARAGDLTDRIGPVVLEPSDFDMVTLFDPNGTVLYSVDESRIGNELAGESERIRTVLKDGPQVRTSDGTVSVMVPLEFRSGVGRDAVVELTRSDDPTSSAGNAWRMMALILALGAVLVAFVLWRTARLANSVGAQASFAQRSLQAAALASGSHPRPEIQAPRPITVPTPGLREEGDARRKAEERAYAAEERLSVLQEQYRKTLEELQVTQRRATEARPDPETQDRLLRAEDRARLLEEEARKAAERLAAVTAERDQLSKVAAELRETSTELDALVRERDTVAAERDDLKEELEALAADRAQLAAEHAQTAAALAAKPDAPPVDPKLIDRLAQSETEAIGLRAELEGAQTQLEILSKDLETARADLSGTATQADRAETLQRDLDGAHVEVLRAREAAEALKTELADARTELEDARAELRALRTEEQRAAMLEDELRSVRAELDSARASHRAELIEREADLEEKVRTIREEFQDQLEATEARHRDELAAQAREAEQRVASVESSATADLEALRRDLADRTDRFAGAEQEIATASAAAQQLGDELTEARTALDQARSAIEGHEAEIARLTEASAAAERQAAEAAARATKLAADLEDATQGNADLNRRLQELEARRALETAAAEGRADLDDLLRITQERLAGQTEKLIAAEERVHDLERDLSVKLERIDEVEGELRQQQMAEAMRQIRGEHEMPAPAGDAVAVGEAVPFDDRRATSPFVKELSLDAKKSLSQILGLTQILKHKKDAKDQAQLIRQLTTFARRLDHVVSDMSDAEELVRGTVQLNPKRTDLEALVQRVVEESGLQETHDVRVETERIVVAIDQLRTEQILAGLLRGAGDRTSAKKVVRIRLRAMDGGALLSVEDQETSSDASLSPVVRRFAEVQGGWARVESVEEGGSAFQVFLPDGSGEGRTTDEDGTTTGDAATNPDLPIVVEGEPDTWDKTAEQILVQELHRLSELAADD
jgi:DNA repair exonuclease SbcCD ATPase subunit